MVLLAIPFLKMQADHDMVPKTVKSRLDSYESTIFS